MNIHQAVGSEWGLFLPNVSTKANVKLLGSYALNRNAQIPMKSAELKCFIFSTPTLFKPPQRGLISSVFRTSQRASWSGNTNLSGGSFCSDAGHRYRTWAKPGQNQQGPELTVALPWGDS